MYMYESHAYMHASYIHTCIHTYMHTYIRVYIIMYIRTMNIETDEGHAYINVTRFWSELHGVIS